MYQKKSLRVARPILVVGCNYLFFPKSTTTVSGSTQLFMFNYGAIIAEEQASGMMLGFQTVHVMEAF